MNDSLNDKRANKIPPELLQTFPGERRFLRFLWKGKNSFRDWIANRITEAEKKKWLKISNCLNKLWFLIDDLKPTIERRILQNFCWGDDFLESLNQCRKYAGRYAKLKIGSGKKVKHSDRYYWCAALVPSLIFRTGKPTWTWLAKLISFVEGRDIDYFTLESWWEKVTGKKSKKVKNLDLLSLDQHIRLFQSAFMYLRWKKLRDGEEKKYLRILLEQIPFLKEAPQMKMELSGEGTI